MNRKNKTSRIIVNPRLFRMILSILAAVLIWTYINGSSIDLIKKDILNIPVQLTGIETLNQKGLYLADGEIQYYVNLRLQGSEKNLKDLNVESITASVDLSDIETAGSFNGKIVIQGLSNTVILEEIKPSALTFNIEEFAERKETLQFVINGQPESGYVVQSVQSELSDQKVIVTGLPTDLGKIDQIAAVVTVTGMNADSKQIVKPIAYDSKGNIIEAVKIKPAEIEATIAVAKKAE